MLLLVTPNDKLRLITGSAGSVHVHASWMDNVSGAISPGRTNTAVITTATTTDVLPSPTSGVFRALKTLHIHNAGSANNLVTLQSTDGSLICDLYRVTLAPKDTLQYIDEVGFQVLVASLGATPGPTRILLQKIVPTAVPNIVVAGALNDSRFGIFELDFKVRHNSATNDEAFAVQFSVDNGATYPNTAGQYHFSGTLANSGGFAGWNTSGGASNSTMGILCNVIGVGQECVGHSRINNDAGHVLVETSGQSWTNSNNAYLMSSHYHCGFYGTPGTATHMKLMWSAGSSFLAFGYINIYGVFK